MWKRSWKVVQRRSSHAIASESRSLLRATYEDTDASTEVLLVGQRYRYIEVSDPARAEAGLVFGLIQIDGTDPEPFALLVLSDGTVMLSGSACTMRGDQTHLPKSIVDDLSQLLTTFLRQNDNRKSRGQFDYRYLSCEIDCWEWYGQYAEAVAILASYFYGVRVSPIGAFREFSDRLTWQWIFCLPQCLIWYGMGS